MQALQFRLNNNIHNASNPTLLFCAGAGRAPGRAAAPARPQPAAEAEPASAPPAPHQERGDQAAAQDGARGRRLRRLGARGELGRREEHAARKARKGGTR